jgi:NADH dehydrogenase
MSRKKIVILGAGFAGLQVARRLKDDCEITLIDQYNFHQFQPLFYQVSTARLEPNAISFPLRKIFQRKKHMHVRIAHVKNINLSNKAVFTDEGNFKYDYLIIATGCSTNYFGNDNIKKHAFAMKSTADAVALRNRILLNFENALKADENELEPIMNIVVAGGGPTGVELAGALAEMKKFILPRDYPDMDFSRLTIYLVEGGAHTLGSMSEVSQKKSRLYLERMGVKVMLNTLVSDYNGDTIQFKDGRTLRTYNLIWAAGVTGNVPEGIPKEKIVNGNRIQVNSYNQVEELENVFAIGDVCYMETQQWPKGHPQLANVAIHQARHLVKNLNRVQHGKQMLPFAYRNPGTMATVGKSKAVVDLPFISFQGFFAWVVWMSLHLMLILSVKNKLLIFFEWANSYLTNDTTLRLILLPTRKQIEMAKEQHDI